jgi:hypothetical protein
MQNVFHQFRMVSSPASPISKRTNGLIPAHTIGGIFRNLKTNGLIRIFDKLDQENRKQRVNGLQFVGHCVQPPWCVV